MPLPLVHLLEPPGFDEGDKGSFDNELKLWGMLRQLRMGLVGQGGPLSGWGFSSGDDGAGVGGIAGEVVYLGAFGQLTVDGTCLLFENSALKRVGVNTCAPQYPLDINSNECDAKIVAIRNGNADADVDMFANYDAAPGARARLSRTDDGVSDPTFQLRFYTNEDIAGVNTLHERLSLSKIVDVKSGFSLSGDITVNIATDQNNWDPPGLESASVVRISTTGNRNITGLSRGTDGAVKIIRNVDVSESVTLVNQSASSITVNRFSLGANAVIPPGGTIILLYDTTILRWVSAAGSSGTGSGITNRIAYWVSPTVLGPVNEFQADGQIMFAATSTRLPAGSNNLLWDQVNNRLRIGSQFLPLNGLDLQSGNESLSTLAISHISDNNFSSANVEGFRLTGSGSLLVNTPLISIRGGGNHIVGGSPTGRSIQGRMEVRAAETWSVSVRGAYISFATTPIGSLTMAQRFVVGPSGEWGIGGTNLATTNFGTAGQVKTSGGTGAPPTWTTPTTGVTDHGALTGLGDDDHTIYFLLAGRAGGQTANGGTAASDKLILHSTSNATKGDIDLHAADITHLAASKHRMVGQNRFRYLNATVRATQAAAQTGLAVNAFQTFTFGAETHDTDNLHDNITNNSRLTASIAGKYTIIGSMAPISNGGTPLVGPTAFYLAVRLNGTTYITIGVGAFDSSNNSGACVAVDYNLAAGDYVELQGQVTATSGQWNTQAGTFEFFAMHYSGE